MIDPRSYTPVYRQLADLLRAQIVDGTLTPGALLPAEYRLAQEHEVSRETVRAALAVLRHEGLVVTKGSYGTRVRPHMLRTEVTVPAGAVWTARMPTPAERENLDLDEGVPVIEVTERRGGAVIYPADRHVFRNV